MILKREKLYGEVWLTPIGQLALRLGMSSARLRSACKTLAIPLPPLGYWTAQRAGKATLVTPLLPHDGPHEVRVGPAERPSAARLPEPKPTLNKTTQPRLVPIAVWAELVFGEHAPHPSTLLRWVQDGQIQPRARKIARIWWVAPNAEYVGD
jgi:hypothetical protein